PRPHAAPAAPPTCLDCGRLGTRQPPSLAAPAPPPTAAAACSPKAAPAGPTGFLPAPHRLGSPRSTSFSPPSLAYLAPTCCAPPGGGPPLQRSLSASAAPGLHEPPATPSAAGAAAAFLLDGRPAAGRILPDCLAFNMFNAAFLRPDGRDRFVSWLAASGARTPSASLWPTRPFGGLLTPLMGLPAAPGQISPRLPATARCSQAVAAPYYLGKRWLRPRLSSARLPADLRQITPSWRSASVSAVRLFSHTCRVPLPPPPAHQLVLRLRPRHSAHWNPHCAACGTCARCTAPARLALPALQQMRASRPSISTLTALPVWFVGEGETKLLTEIHLPCDEQICSVHF
uniref:COesterase domain-containing protein n=1 Tax=Macrostomum lignano TaxID=282301 RepID=A0A1I8FN69_9PLAT